MSGKETVIAPTHGIRKCKTKGVGEMMGSVLRPSNLTIHPLNNENEDIDNLSNLDSDLNDRHYSTQNAEQMMAPGALNDIDRERQNLELLNLNVEDDMIERTS